MISLDTNILVRIVVKDDDAQVDLARRLLRQMKEKKEHCLVTIVVLCELQWVLTRIYKASRKELASIVEMLLNDDIFILEETELVRKALERALRSESGFAILEESILA